MTGLWCCCGEASTRAHAHAQPRRRCRPRRACVRIDNAQAHWGGAAVAPSGSPTSSSHTRAHVCRCARSRAPLPTSTERCQATAGGHSHVHIAHLSKILKIESTIPQLQNMSCLQRYSLSPQNRKDRGQDSNVLFTENYS